jgi:1-acyl-sn-glycerol-3-phosphate acyltransferase
MEKLKICRDWILMMLGFAYWGIGGLLVTLISLVLYWILPERYAQPCGKIIIQKALKLFIDYFKVARLLILDDADLNQLAQLPGAMIIAPNHLALWDAVFIIAKIPNLTCIMKGAILRNPLLGGGSRLAGYIPNDSTPQMLHSATHAAKKGARLLIFPEGTRTKPEVQWMNPLKGGVALISKYSHVPVMPVYIRSNSRFLEKDRPLFNMPDFPIRISINVGAPLYFAKGETVEHFNQRFEQHYLDELSKTHPLCRQPV